MKKTIVAAISIATSFAWIMRWKKPALVRLFLGVRIFRRFIGYRGSPEQGVRGASQHRYAKHNMDEADEALTI
jgi:hypothetical protein